MNHWKKHYFITVLYPYSQGEGVYCLTLVCLSVCLLVLLSVCPFQILCPNFLSNSSLQLLGILTHCLLKHVISIGIYIVPFNVNFPLYNFQSNFIKDFSTTVQYRCFKFKHTLCLSMAYVGIYFCTIKRQLPVK